MAELLRPDIPHQVGGGVAVAVGVAVEAGHAQAGPLGTPVFRLVELLLHEGSQQQSQALDLLGIQDAIKQGVIVVQGNQLSLGDVPQIGSGGKEDGRGKFRQEAVRQIELHVEPGQVSAFLLFGLVNGEFGKDHAPFLLLGMRQRQEADGKQPLLSDFLRGQGGQFFPGHARGQFGPDACLDGFAPSHSDPWGRVVAQVVAAVQEFHLPGHHLGFFLLQSGHSGGEGFGDVHRQVAGFFFLSLGLIVLAPGKTQPDG